jgi:hypothetical protein
MRHFHATSCGFSLVELAISLVVATILFLIGWTSWELGWSGIRDMQRAGVAYQNAFGVMNSIEVQVHGCKTIQLLTGCTSTSSGTVVANPGNTAYHGIQLSVPVVVADQVPAGTTVNRAFWLAGTNLMMQNEVVGPVTIFSNVSSFTAAMVDAPTNSLVQLNCTCTGAGAGTESIAIATVAHRRN